MKPSNRDSNDAFKRLLQPRSIAVFGGSVAVELIRQCDRLGFTGEIWPVHPKKDRVEGRRAYRSVAELPGCPDASFIGVNRERTIDIVRELANLGAGGAVCYATGYTESGEEGARLAEALRIASGDMPLIGPNCYGMLNFIEGAALWPDQQGGYRVDSGVAIICMSSNVAFNLTMQRRGLPIAYLLSLGNQLKFALDDAIRVFARESRVSAIGLYLESIDDPRGFDRACRYARECGKPIVALKSGRSEVAQRMVVSHTASMAGSDTLVSALMARCGVARVRTLESMLEALKVLHVLGPLAGRKMAAMSTSGGDLALLADGMARLGLELPPLSESTTDALRAVAHERVRKCNPLDFQMFGWNDAEQLGKIFTAFLGDPFDAALCVLDYPRADRCDPSDWSGAERGFIEAARKTRTPGAVLSTFSDTISEDVADRLLDAGIAPLAGIESALDGLAVAVEIGEAWKRPQQEDLLPCTEIVEEPGLPAFDEARSMLRLADAGVPIPRFEVVQNVGEALEAARKLGYPLAVKALGIDHKTDAGGVFLGVRDAQELVAAAESVSQLGERFVVAAMVEGAVAEIIVGVNRDPQFGLSLLVGSGGVLVELLGDSACLLLPTNREEVRKALLGLRCAIQLRGFRGAPPGDLEACIDAVMAVAGFATLHSSELLELDINPLLVLPEGQGVVAVDALLRMNEPTWQSGERT
jgi:acyl-CoA synthetase (NDP forming)